MKDLIYSTVALILGFILGVLTVASAIGAFALWVYSDEKKKPKNSGTPRKSYVEYMRDQEAKKEETQ